ncbi:hypothetical protein BH10BAC2_BH10BAC2_40800 [soil metagenome]
MLNNFFKSSFFFPLLFLTFLFKSHAQSKILDSLHLVITNTKDIKAKIDALNRYAFEIRNKKRDTSKILATEALLLSKIVNYKTGTGEAYYNLGTFFYLKNNDSALFYFKRSVQEYTMADPGLLKVSRSYNGVTNVFMQLPKYDSAIYYGRFAMAYISGHKDTGALKIERLMYSYGTLGSAYYYGGYYDSSITYYLKAAETGERIHNYAMLTSYYLGIANIQATEKKYSSSVYYGRKSAEACHIVKDYESLVLTLANIGGYYSRMDSFVQSRIYTDSSLRLGELYNVTRYQPRNYTTLGTIEMHYNNYENALIYFKTGLASAESKEANSYAKYVLLKETGNTYMWLDSLNLAKENYMLSLKAGEGDQEHEASCHIGLSTVYLKEGDYKNAYEHLQKGKTLYDSVFSAEKTKIINELNTRYETEKKEQQLIILAKEQQLKEAQIARQQQQIITSELLAKEQQQLITLGEFQFHKQAQQIKIRDLTLENNQSQLQQQQLTITNTGNKLKVEEQQKELQAAVISRQQNGILLLLITIVAAAIIIALFFNRYQLNKKIESQRVLMNERVRISRELHDDVGSTLSGISMYSHLTKEHIKQSNFTEVEKSVTVMQQSAGEMVNKLNDIVWLINPEQDSLQKLVQRLEEYAREMAMIKNMQVKVTVPVNLNTIELPIEPRRNIYLFCKEAINNAVKYSNASVLKLTIRESGGQLEFCVTDNGKGFDAATIKRGNGLNNIQKRADEIGAKLILLSKQNEGALLSMQVKIIQ